MYLKEIKIHGFKSFADKIKLEFCGEIINEDVLGRRSFHGERGNCFHSGADGSLGRAVFKSLRGVQQQIQRARPEGRGM